MDELVQYLLLEGSGRSGWRWSPFVVGPMSCIGASRIMLIQIWRGMMVKRYGDIWNASAGRTTAGERVLWTVGANLFGQCAVPGSAE
ncbi:MAG TPA: hypothetical protein DHV63_12210 [Pseudomonas sp.]|nr:hypothetical protein [Pseudomonas sp.]